MTAVARPSSVADAIRSRRSVRAFLPEPVPAADLDEILTLTSLAPSSDNLQPWRFVVVQDEPTRRALALAAYGQSSVLSAPVVVVVHSDMEDALRRVEEVVHPGFGPAEQHARAARLRERFARLSLAERAVWANAQANIALGFLLLAARSLGYDTVPLLGIRPDEVRTLLDLPAHAQIAAVVPLGRRAEPGFDHHRLPLDVLVR